MAQTAGSARRKSAKKVKRTLSSGQVHIYSTFNNTIVTVTDLQGNAVLSASAGYFEKDERGKTKCVACGLCMAVCPSQCIYIVTAEDEEGRRYPLTYELDVLRCIFCGYCEEACPVNAIFVGKNYEWVEEERKPFLMDTEKLLAEKKFNPYS